jgi:hypothetical protein
MLTVLVGFIAMGVLATSYFLALLAITTIFDARLHVPLFFTLSHRAPAAGSVCPICHDESDAPHAATACGHAFHRACIKSWLLRAPTCPVCRADLAVPSRRAVYLLCRKADDHVLALTDALWS